MTLDEVASNIGRSARYTPANQFIEFVGGKSAASHVGVEEVTILGTKGSFVVVGFMNESKTLSRPSRLELL